MEINIARLAAENLGALSIHSKCLRNFAAKSTLHFRTFTNTSSATQRLLPVNILLRWNHRNYAKWSPNIVKSPVMNYPIPEGTLANAIWSRMDQWADKIALVCGITGREMKYHELQEMSKRFGGALLSDVGLTSGQVIATILPNMLEYPPVLLGAIEAGIIVTPVNPIYTVEEISGQLQDSGAVAAVTLPDKLAMVMEAVSLLNKPNFKIIVTPNIDGSGASNEKLPANVILYSQLITDPIHHNNLDSLKPKTISPNHTTLIPYSSGTTGKPKGVCLTHRNLLANNANIKYLRHIWDTTNKHQDVVPLLLPIFHVYALGVILCAGLFSGAKLITLPKFEEATFLKALKHYQATVLYVAPPLVLYLGNSGSVSEQHLISVRTIISGAAPQPISDIQKCIDKSGGRINVIQGYGLTETSPCVCCVADGVRPSNLNTVGMPAPNTEVKIVDLETGQALGANEEGEIWVKGPQVMKGYLNNPKATEECIDTDGWFHTGDIGYYDEKKNFYVTERVKELIKVKGFQVAPSELEAVLRSHENVEDAGVIGISHPQHGEMPIAFIKTNIKDEALMVNELNKFLGGKLAKYKQISKYFFIKNIPKSAAGKILRKDLKAMYLSLTDNK